MAAIYPIDYPFNVDTEGWPEPVYAPPYPFEHYYDNGRNPRPIPTTSQFRNDYHYRSDASNAVPLAIRRHTPASIDPYSQQLSSRSLSPKATPPRVNVHRNQSQIDPRSVSVDPDERPIKPMRNTTVYKPPTQPRKPIQPKKPPPRILQPIRTPPRYEPDSFRPPPSRTPTSRVSERRPIRTDLIPRTHIDTPPRRHHHPPRRVILEEYEDDDYYPVTYVKSLPKRFFPSRNISRISTREFEDYQPPRVRRVVRVRSPPTETIIYRT